MPTIPSPLFALVGATDALTASARALPDKLAAFEIRRFEGSTVDLTALDPRKLQLRKPELSKIDLSKVDVRKIDVRNVDVTQVTGSARDYASKGQQRYDAFVARGEAVVARVREQQQGAEVSDNTAAADSSGPSPIAVAQKQAAAKKATPKPTPPTADA